MEFSVSFVLCAILLCGACFADSSQSDVKDDIREVVSRLALLERKMNTENNRDLPKSKESTSFAFAGVREETTIMELKTRLQMLEEKVFKQEIQLRDTNTYKDRIKTLEDTVKEIPKLLKKQIVNENHIKKLESMIAKEQQTLNYKLEGHTFPKLPFDISIPSENRVQGEYIKFEEETESEYRFNIRNTDAQNRVPDTVFIKKRLLAPISTTSTPLTPSPTANIVAFYAYRSATVHSITGYSTLVFDVTKTNFGNGYHHSTGVFIAPETGVYVFTWIIRENGSCRHSTQLMVNTAELGIIHVHAGSGGDIAGTGVVVTHVNAGDDVYVRTHESWNDCYVVSDGAGRSSFAGWKLS